MSRDPEDIAYISQLHDEATEAAQEIERLRAEVKRLRGFLSEAESVLRHVWSKAATNPFPVPFEEMTRRWRGEEIWLSGGDRRVQG